MIYRQVLQRNFEKGISKKELGTYVVTYFVTSSGIQISLTKEIYDTPDQTSK